MRITGKVCFLAGLAGLLLSASMASAVTLGRVRGAALIGRPINFTVAVSLDPPEAEPCQQADLLQGDTRVAGATARLERAPDGGQQLRITAPGVLEEPVLTAYVRAGCGQQVTRRYVLLAEYPDESKASLPAAAPAPPRIAATPVPVPATPLRAEPRLKGDAAPRRSRAAENVAEAPREKAAERPLRAKKSRAAPAAAQARLKLEPIDLSVDTSPTLQGATELRSRPSAGAKRTEAAALWQALNMPPEELVRQNQRIEAMESQVKSLRDVVQQNTTALNQVGDQLRKARSERNGASMLSAVLSLLLVVAAGLWVWRRSQGDDPSTRRWWQGSGPRSPETQFPDDAPIAPAPARTAEAQPSAVDLDLSGYFDPDAPKKPRTVAVPKGPPRSGPQSDFMHSQPAIMRMVKAEELIDIQQQAEFFFTIGQTQQALAVLESHVHDHVETSPIAWLDLLDAYHRLNRPDDYERVRSEFHALFNAQVPPFDDYRQASSGLEDYRRALSRIVALWPSPRVLGVIEESIFRKPGTPGAEPFDLQAYRDLLMLYNVAQELVRCAGEGWRSAPEAEAPSIASEFGNTNLQPLSARNSDLSYPPSAPPMLAPNLALPSTEIPPASPNLGLDIDLAALEPPEPDAIGGPPSSMLSFDLELLPPAEPPSDTSRR
jgi:hypothetical protein